MVVAPEKGREGTEMEGTQQGQESQRWLAEIMTEVETCVPFLLFSLPLPVQSSCVLFAFVQSSWTNRINGISLTYHGRWLLPLGFFPGWSTLQY